MTTPRPPAPQPLSARPLSIASCSWDTLVAELGDPFAGRTPPEPAPAPRTGPLPAIPTAPATTVLTLPAGYQPRTGAGATAWRAGP